MSDARVVREAVWLVDGGPPPRRTHPLVRLDLVDADATGPDDRCSLVDDAVAATRSGSRPVGITVATCGGGRFLAVAATTDGRDPSGVLAWLLGAAPDLPSPAPDDSPPVELPRTLRSGTAPSGSAYQVVRAVPPDIRDGVRRLTGTGTPVEAVLASAVGILLGHYLPEEPHVTLLVTTPRPAVLRVPAHPRGGLDRLLRSTVGALADAAGPPTPHIPTIAVGRGEGEAEAVTVGSHRVVPWRPPGRLGGHELVVELTGDRLRVDHDAALFAPEAVAVLADRLLAVLGALAEGTPVHDVSAATEEEHALLGAWSRGDSETVPRLCLHTLVERRADATPDALALTCGEVRLTYAELNAAANRLAHRLLAAGVGRGDVVAVRADRTAWSVVAMLGILKAAACYVPVEPSYPRERQEHILTDSGARLLVTAGHPGAATGVPVLDLLEPTTADTTNPEVPADQDDAAYLIYTSGSTGHPKGVRVHHRAIVVSTHARRIGGAAPVRDLVTMPLCFDGAAGGLYWTLTSGGTVVLPTEAEARDPLAMARLLASAPVTHIHSVPSHYGLILEATDGEHLDQLRLVSVGGEPMPPTLVARHLLTCPDALLLNDYGPTECAVWASAHPCGIAEATGDRVPIGRPLPNYRLHVLDGDLRPVPPGLPGEIYIGGPAVATGYHRRPRLTAERFLPDPFGAPGERLYRTGDRGEWTADGLLVTVGRVDNQVKVRGFRVELGEIEAAVRRHRAVLDCAVTLRATGGGQDVLVAFVATAAPDLDDADLRGEVARTLPAYMHPDHFVTLPELPRNASGKIDVGSLRGLAIPAAPSR